MTLSIGRGVELPYAHPSVAAARGLAGVLAPRERWSERDLARLTRLFATRAADEFCTWWPGSTRSSAGTSRSR